MDEKSREIQNLDRSPDKIDNRITSYRHAYRILAALIAVALTAYMIFIVGSLPSFGDPDNPANNEVSRKYIEDGLTDTGAVNIVSGMILDYRAFDTFGESTVLFVSSGAVIILLRNKRKADKKGPTDLIYKHRPDVILKHVAKFLVPIALLFGIYIILNGHLSPGGGFSGGAILGGALILYFNAFGAKEMEKFFTYRTFNSVIITSLVAYALVKSYSFYTGANQIHSVIPLGTPGHILSSGLILPLNIFVGLIVMCTMFGFYSLFQKEEI